MPDQSRYRYHADEDQWWMYRDGEPRQRAEERTCKACGDRFVVEISERTEHCSRQCGSATARETNLAKRDGGPGNVYVDAEGYRRIWWPEHELANEAGWVLEHRLVASRAIGKPLPGQAVVHHVNEDVGDNRPENLVVCEDTNYHTLLHRRHRALRECGHPDWRRCGYCQEYGPAEDMKIVDRVDHDGDKAHHPSCFAEFVRERRQKHGR